MYNKYIGGIHTYNIHRSDDVVYVCFRFIVILIHRWVGGIFFLSLQPIGKIFKKFYWHQIHLHAYLICTLLNNFLFSGRFLNPLSSP